MLSTGAAPPAVQLAITLLLLCLVPTLAMFGLLRLLDRLRNDELIERWAANNDEPVQPDVLNAFLAESSGDGSSDASPVDRSTGAADRSDGALAADAGSASADASSASTADAAPAASANAASVRSTDEATAESGVRCRHCGAPNPEGVHYCEACIGRL